MYIAGQCDSNEGLFLFFNGLNVCLVKLYFKHIPRSRRVNFSLDDLIQYVFCGEDKEISSLKKYIYRMSARPF